MQPPETRYAKSDGVSIAYQISGAGPIDVVFAPGTMSHLDMDWETPRRAHFISRLSSFCRLIRFDKRGTGLSDRPTHMATLEERTDDIRAVMDAAGSESAVIFGVSEGGSMACLFAATYPHRTRSLMVWGAQARWIKSEDHPWGQTPQEHDAMMKMLEDEWPSVDYICGPGVGLGPNPDPANLALVVKYLRAGASPSAVQAYEAMNAEIDTRPILPAIRCSALIMNRTGDPCANVNAARDMASRIPGARFVEYPGESHSMMLDDVEEILAEMQEFITGQRPIQSADRILATVLFLDIVGSTERAVQLGDKLWGTVLDRYYTTVRREVARHLGTERNNAGDGFLITFDGPARAVRCGLAIAQAVKEMGIEIRAGVHIGEVELMGDNIGGIAVHIGARVMGTAQAGTVWTSGTVKDLVAGSGIIFSPSGVYDLKGVPGSWQLYTATA